MIFAALRRLSLVAGLVASLAIPVCAQGIVGPGSGGGPADKPGWVLKNALSDCDFANGRYYNCIPDVHFLTTRAAVGLAPLGTSNLVPFGNNQSRITDNGFLIEGATTNLALWGRDWTQAGTWTATNLTTALNAVGLDQSANSATTLTATSAGGTATQSLSFGSGTYIFSVYLKRVSGSGSVQLTTDNFVGTATCTLVTNAWTRCGRGQAGITSAIVGVRLNGSGDVVLVDGAQMEISLSPGVSTSTSVIFTDGSTAARTAETTVYNGKLSDVFAGAGSVWSLFVQDASRNGIVGINIPGSGGTYALRSAGTGNVVRWNNAANAILASTASAACGTGDSGNSKVIGSTNSGSTGIIACNFGTPSAGNALTMAADTAFGLGNAATGGNNGYINIQRLAFWPRQQIDPFSHAQLTCISGVC